MKLSQTEKRQISYDITYFWNLKYDTNELIYKNKIEIHWHREHTCGLPRGKRECVEEDSVFGISRCRLSHMEWINNKVLLSSTRKYTQYSVINHNRIEYKKECLCRYNWITVLCSRNLHNIVNQLYFNNVNFKKWFLHDITDLITYFSLAKKKSVPSLCGLVYILSHICQ